MAKKDLLNIKEFPPTVEQFRQMDECVVHITLKWMGRTYMAGDATIWHVVDSDVAFGQIASNGNIFQGAIMRTSIDKVMSVPQEVEGWTDKEVLTLKEQLSKYKEMISEIEGVIQDYGDIIDFIETGKK